MAEEVAFAIAEYIGEDWVFAEALAQAITVAAFVGGVYYSHEQQRKAQNAARAKAEESLKDRYVMARSAIEPRRVVLGRQRVSGPLAYIGSYGTYREHLVFDVLLAAHEIDAIESIYFDDEQVTLDGSGNVIAINRKDQFSITGSGGTFTLTSAPAAGSVTGYVDYGTTRVTVSVSMAGSVATVSGATAGATGLLSLVYQPAQTPYIIPVQGNQVTTATLDSSGNASVTLPTIPDSGSVNVVYAISNIDGTMTDLNAFASVAGSVVTISAGVQWASVTVSISYMNSVITSRARVRKYLGAAGQAADAGMITNLSGVWTSSHTLTGQAHMVVELDYDPDAFPQGVPNVSAQVRGAKVYDPRTGVTAWSENPALLMRHVAMHPLLGRLAASVIDDTSIIAAANVCDQTTNYVVGGQTYTRALYTAGTVAKSGQRAKDVLDDLSKAMGGKWAMVNGKLRVRAGAYVTPLQSLDDTWLADKQAVQVQPRTKRVDLVNVLTGKLVDEQRDYLELEYPRVASSTYIAADGAELAQDFTMNACTFVGQAQQVAAIYMRDLRYGARVTLTCNFKAWHVELFDTLTVTLSRFGWVNKTFEVLDVQWTVDGGIQLSLKETDPSIYALATSFDWNLPPAPTLFPQWNQVPAVAGLTCAAGTSQLLRQADGTIISRIEVNWTAINDAAVVNDGGIEIRYGLATQAESQWRSQIAPRGQSKDWLTENVKDGLIFLVKARAFNALVKGAWSLPVLVSVGGKSTAPSNVSGLATAAIPGGVQITWTPNADVDYLETEVRYGASWAAGTQIFRGAAAGFVWPWPASGSYTVRVKHRDTSKNESAEATASITVDNGNLIDRAQLVPSAATEVVADSGSLSYSFVSSTAGFEYRVQRLKPISWTNNTGATVTVELQAQIRGTKSAGPGQVWIDAASASAALTSNVFSSLVAINLHTEVTSVNGTYAHTDSIDVTNGATIYFALTVYIYSAVGTTTDFAGDGRIRIVAIKR